MIRVFGDSHAMKFGDHYPTAWIAGLTCYGFCGGDISLMVENIFNKAGIDGLIPRREVGWSAFKNFLEQTEEEDIILFVLGEPDCRIQFYYHHMRDGVPLQDLIDTTIKRYMDFLSTVDRRVAVLDVIPANDQGNVYQFEFYADRQIRAEITMMFNRTLKSACEENGVTFVSLWNLLADENGFLKPEMTAPDNAHAKPDPVLFAEVERQLC